MAIFIDVLLIGWVLIFIFAVMIEASSSQNEPVEFLVDCELSWSSCSAGDCAFQRSLNRWQLTVAAAAREPQHTQRFSHARFDWLTIVWNKLHSLVPMECTVRPLARVVVSSLRLPSAWHIPSFYSSIMATQCVLFGWTF